MDFIILAHPSDETALRVAVLLRHRNGAERVQIRTPEELFLAGWEHRLSASGVRTEIRLHDGSRLDGGRQAVIFNRLTTIDPPMFAASSPVNREYARMEMFALLLSWLQTQKCVVNPASPSGLAGCTWRPMVWQHAALQCGFRTLNLGATTSSRRFPPPSECRPRPDLNGIHGDALGYPGISRFTWYSAPMPERRASALVIGNRVIGQTSEATAAACLRLAKRTRMSLLRIEFACGESPDVPDIFLSCDPFPSIADGSALVQLVSYLESVAQAERRTAG